MRQRSEAAQFQFVAFSLGRIEHSACKVARIDAAGTYTVTNSRNGHSKTYRVKD